MQNPVGKTLRLIGVAAAMGLALLAAGCSKSNSSATVAPDEMSMGPADAKITVIEYASVACPICAHVNESVMPQFKAKYIDTGKVRYVYRPMMTGNPAVAAAGHLLAECAGKDKYFNVVDQVMRSQGAMGGEETGYANARPVLFSIGQALGMSETDFNKCITDEKGLARLNDLNQKYLTKDGINGTPTFLINGKKYDRIPQTIQDFDEALKPYLGK
ncbi:MAG: thioredoxin domain-containing protein [Asticcacaulis sp.]|uniref:thioredoxin domain-containing protein n=1 Tax=Asticcacaulis sp. TaxID=1872648 RepID=UPI0039E23DF9